ncbi:MAG: TonB family protein [Holophagales bacterium]|nr:TonB family protein [Holophagales bacterium]
MNTRDQFGNYLLLKKLSEDALGETFRAGRIGKQGLERVVLLRVFNGQGLDGEKLGQRMQARAGVHPALKSPNLGQGVDLGQVRGVPYAAYDYVSGRSLAQLAEQATKKRSPVPLDHALLMAERIGLGLAVAYETRIGNERILHGSLTPHQVLVSNEGELRVLGFESSTGLREFASHPILKEAVGRYLSPEALAGQPPSKADDVWSLGAILYELLTSQKLPLSGPAGHAALIDQAVVAADGGNLHPDLANLLKRSLVARDQRIGDVVTWHKTLAKLMFDGQYNPTTFNLAFFMHNLFREEIERETQELELEKTTQIPVQQIAAAAQPARAAAAAPATSAVRDTPGAVREDTSVLRERYEIEGEKQSSNKGLVIGGAVAAVALLAVLGWFLFGRGGSQSQQAAQASVPTPAVDVQPTAAPTPAGPTPEEIQSQIERIVQEKLQSTSTQYEEQLKQLQKQLEDAKKAREATPPPVERPAATQVAQATLTAPTPAATAAPTPAPKATEAPTQVARATPTPAPTAAPTQAPAVRVGDLVEAGPGVVAPRLTRQPALRYPPLAQRMRKEATVVVRVLVDERGQVVQAERSGTEAGFGLDDAAVEFAKACGYSPATKDGVKVKMWTDLKVAFTLSGR